ncbi:MAG: fasciclin domain-containing protein [Planctomycetota bacterium]
MGAFVAVATGLTGLSLPFTAPAVHAAGPPNAVTTVLAQGIDTLQGVPIPVTESLTGPRLGGFSILSADVLAANGIIHAIDGVLVPPGVLAQLQ